MPAPRELYNPGEMPQPYTWVNRHYLWPLLLTITTFLFYLFTLAPTVLWGDDAYFQHTAFTAELRPDGGGHWLWLQVARLFVRLPLGDVAFRTNLLSAVAATATILLLYAAGREAGLRRDAATVAALSLAVGHTFWMHAVRAEVYTLLTLFLAAHFWLWARWCRPESESIGNGPMYASATLFGVTLLAHQMALLLLPAFAMLLWKHRHHAGGIEMARAAALALLGLMPFFIVVYMQIAAVAGVSILEAFWLYFTHAGTDFGSALFDFSLAGLKQDLFFWGAMTALQFVGPALVLILWGLLHRQHHQSSALWPALLVFYLTDVFFAISFRVSDRYVFFLPGYLALALFAGAGWLAARSSSAEHRRKRDHWLAACLILLVAVPIATYYVAPRFVAALDLNPMTVRTLPGREPNRFFLWPAKHGYTGALRYGEQALAVLPVGAVLLADHTPLETLKYLQIVEGMRQDLTLVKVEPGIDLAPLIASFPPATPIYLADDNPEYYNLRSLPRATLAPVGPVFRLQLATQTSFRRLE